MAVCKPLLAHVIDAAEKHAAVLDRPPPLYSVEIKSRAAYDGRYHPPPYRYARLVIDEFEKYGVFERSSIQSFDPRALREARRIRPGIQLVLLVENRRGYESNVDALGFLPHCYSPSHKLVDRALIERVHHDAVAVLPWTVNDPRRMRHLLEIGVDGFITDYPDSGREVVDAFLRERGASVQPIA